MGKVLDCGLRGSEIDLQSRYYVQFQTKALGKAMTPSYPHHYELTHIATVLFNDGLSSK